MATTTRAAATVARRPTRRACSPTTAGCATSTPAARRSRIPRLTASPIPRLPDGHVDLTGPWVGGGSNGDIERDGGLKPGELPLLPWAKELRDKRLAKDEPYTACLPMSVPRVNPYPWKFAMSYTVEGPHAHLRAARDRRRRRASRRLHGRPQAPGRSDPDLVGPLDRPLGRRHARHRHRRLQRQVLVRQPRHAAHRAAAHRSSGGRASTAAASTTTSRSTIRARSRSPVKLHVHGRLLRPDRETGGGDLMEFICLEDNEYGRAAQIEVGKGTGRTESKRRMESGRRGGFDRSTHSSGGPAMRRFGILVAALSVCSASRPRFSRITGSIPSTTRRRR